MHLALNQVFIHQVAEIIGHGVAIEADSAGLRVQLDFRHMRTVGEGAPDQRNGLAVVQQVRPPGRARAISSLAQCQPQVGARRAKAPIGKRHAFAQFSRQKGAEIAHHSGNGGGDRAALYGHGTRPPGAAAFCNAVAVALDHPDQTCIDPGLRRHHLCINRFMALTVALRAHIDRNLAVRLELDSRGFFGAAQNRFDIERKTHAPHEALEAGSPRPRRKTVHISFGAYPVQNAYKITVFNRLSILHTVRKRRDEVAPAQIKRVNPEAARRIVHRAFQRQDGLGPPRTAICIDRRCVGIDSAGPQMNIGDIIAARHHLAEQGRLDGLRELRIVCAHIRQYINAIGGYLEVFVKAELGPRHQIARAVVRQHRLGPFRHPAHRPAQHFCGLRNQDIFGVDHAFHAKTATDIGVRHPHILAVKPHHAHQLVFLDPDPLPVDTQMQARPVPFGKGAARLHRIADDAVVHHIQRHTMSRSGHRRRDTGRLTHRPVIGAIVGCQVMHHRPTRRDGQLDRPIVGLQRDQLRRIARRIQAFGHDHRDSFADIAQHPLGQQRPKRVGALAAILVAHGGPRHAGSDPGHAEALRGQHQPDTRHLCCRRDIKPGDGGMCHRRAQEKGEKCPVRRDVIDILPPPRQKPSILEPSRGLWPALGFSELLHCHTRHLTMNCPDQTTWSAWIVQRCWRPGGVLPRLNLSRRMTCVQFRPQRRWQMRPRGSSGQTPLPLASQAG